MYFFVLCLVSICRVLKVWTYLVSFRILRVQKEKEEAERKQAEAIMQYEQEQQKFIEEKEREILQLQVGFFSMSCFVLAIFIVCLYKKWKYLPGHVPKCWCYKFDVWLTFYFDSITGGCKELHHLGELRPAYRRSSGQSKELQLCHWQGRQSCETDNTAVNAPTDPAYAGHTVAVRTGIWDQNTGKHSARGCYQTCRTKKYLKCFN